MFKFLKSAFSSAKSLGTHMGGLSDYFVKIGYRLSLIFLLIAAYSTFYDLPIFDSYSVHDFVLSFVQLLSYCFALAFVPYISESTALFILDIYYFWITYHFFRFIVRP